MKSATGWSILSISLWKVAVTPHKTHFGKVIEPRGTQECPFLLVSLIQRDMPIPFGEVKYGEELGLSYFLEESKGVTRVG